MNNDLGNTWTPPQRYKLIYLIFVPENVSAQGHTVEVGFNADSIERIIDKVTSLKQQRNYVGIVGIQDKNGDYV